MDWTGDWTGGLTFFALKPNNEVCSPSVLHSGWMRMTHCGRSLASTRGLKMSDLVVLLFPQSFVKVVICLHTSLQLVNYGIGGHIEPHYGFPGWVIQTMSQGSWHRPSVLPCPLLPPSFLSLSLSPSLFISVTQWDNRSGSGNRIATVLFYISPQESIIHDMMTSFNMYQLKIFRATDQQKDVWIIALH